MKNESLVLHQRHTEAGAERPSEAQAERPEAARLLTGAPRVQIGRAHV